MQILGKSLALCIACVFSIVAMIFPQLLKQCIVLLRSILLTTSQLLQTLQSDNAVENVT